MPISEYDVHDIVTDKIARLANPNDAIREAYFTVAMRIYGSLVPPRDDPPYWKAVVHAVRMKTELGSREMDPGVDQEDHQVRFAGTYTQVLLSVLEHYGEVLTYIHDHFSILPDGVYRRIRTLPSIVRELARVDHERERYLRADMVKEVVLVPRERFAELNVTADILSSALLGNTFQEFTSQFNTVAGFLRKFQAALGRSGSMTN